MKPKLLREARSAGLHDLEQGRLAFAELLGVTGVIAEIDTRTSISPVISSPANSTFWKMRVGSLHSSAMFTESSKPTMAKKASVVAAITGQNALPSPAVFNWVTRDTSPCPSPIAHRPITMMINRPQSSTQVERHSPSRSRRRREVDRRDGLHERQPYDRDADTDRQIETRAHATVAAQAREAVDA